MYLILWIIAVIMVVAGIIRLTERQWLIGAILIVGGLLIGPGGASIWT